MRFIAILSVLGSALAATNALGAKESLVEDEACERRVSGHGPCPDSIGRTVANEKAIEHDIKLPTPNKWSSTIEEIVGISGRATTPNPASPSPASPSSPSSPSSPASPSTPSPATPSSPSAPPSPSIPSPTIPTPPSPSLPSPTIPPPPSVSAPSPPPPPPRPASPSPPSPSNVAPAQAVGLLAAVGAAVGAAAIAL